MMRYDIVFISAKFELVVACTADSALNYALVLNVQYNL